VHVLSTDRDRIPLVVQSKLDELVLATQHCHNGLHLNICISYGGRGEIIQACQRLAQDCMDGIVRKTTDINEDMFERYLLTHRPKDNNNNNSGTQCVQLHDQYHPNTVDVLIRTSGEVRISNFLLWQLAYTEMFFIDKKWPEITKYDFINVLRQFATSRQRRYGQ
jgi:undecaprenyl diphosphate synthase